MRGVECKAKGKREATPRVRFGRKATGKREAKGRGLSYDDVARRIGIGRWTMHKWMKAGLIPFLRHGRYEHCGLAKDDLEFFLGRWGSDPRNWPIDLNPAIPARPSPRAEVTSPD